MLGGHASWDQSSLPGNVVPAFPAFYHPVEDTHDLVLPEYKCVIFRVLNSFVCINVVIFKKLNVKGFQKTNSFLK